MFFRCAKKGLFDRCVILPNRISPGALTKKILAIHTQKHFDKLANTTSMNPTQLEAESGNYDSIYFHNVIFFKYF